MLHERGVFVVPDILANAGGVTASYFEWVQDRHGYFWTEEEVNERLEAKMIGGVRDGAADGAALPGRHAHRRLHRRHRPRRDGDADARHVRLRTAVTRTVPGLASRRPRANIQARMPAPGFRTRRAKEVRSGPHP